MMAIKTKYKNLGRRGLSLFLSLVMALSLVQITAFATGPEDTLNPPVVTAENGALTLSKTAERTAANEWEVTLSTTVKDIEIEQQPLEIVFVLDKSGSMNWCDLGIPHGDTTYNNAPHDDSCETELVCGKEAHNHESAGCTLDCTKTVELKHCTRGHLPFEDTYTHRDGRKCTFIDGQWYYEVEHVHNDSCYSCGLEEHTHTDSCYEYTCNEYTLANGTTITHQHTYPRNADRPECNLTGKTIVVDGQEVQVNTRWGTAVNAVNRLVANLPEGSRVRYVAYSDSVSEITTSGNLKDYYVSGGTNPGAGFNFAIDSKNGLFTNNPNSRKVIVMVGDGNADKDEYYPTTAAQNWKDASDRNIIYTISFQFSDEKFSALASEGCALNAKDADALDLAMEQISADISAMIYDNMGDTVINLTQNPVVTGITDGTIDAGEDLITWTPGETTIKDNTITITYTVQLPDSVWQNEDYVGEDNEVVLNGHTYLDYAIVENGVKGEAKSLDFNVPEDAIDVGSLDVSYQCNGADIAHIDAPDTQYAITDWTDSPTFNTHYVETIQVPNSNHYYVYTGSTLDGVTVDGGYADVATIAATTGSHSIIHNYRLVEMYNVSYAYTGDVPEDLDADIDVDDLGGLEEAGTSVNVEAEPTSEKYVFSGWTTTDAEVADGSFTMPHKDVEFVGSWTIKPSYKVQANYFTSVDGGAYTQDNTNPIGLCTVQYTTETSASYEIQPFDYVYGPNTYTSVEPADGSAGTLSSGVVSDITPNTDTAVVTLNFYRTVQSPATYVVNHEYYDVAPNGTETKNTDDSYTTAPVTGVHGQNITAASITADTTGNSHHSNGYYEVTGRSSDITLDKNQQKAITITYKHYQYQVTTSGDAGVASLTEAKTYNKGQNASVTFSLKPGYRLVSVTDNGVDVTSKVEDNMYAISNISANHEVVVTTAKIPYTLTVQYVFADGNKPATGFEDYTDTKYYGDSYAATAIAAPAGYTRTDSGNTSGTITGDVTVIYLYVPNGRASVTVYYVDADTGMHLLMPQTDTGLIGTGFDMSAHKKDSITIGSKIYDLVNKNEVMTGTYVKGGTNIRLEYRERTTYTVTVKYVSEDTSKAVLTKDSYTETKYAGSDYNVSDQITDTVVADGKTWYYSGNALATGDAFSGTLDGNKTITVKYYLKPTWSVLATYYTVVNGEPDTKPLTVSNNGTGKVGEAVPFDRSKYDDKDGFSASNFNNDLKVNGTAVSEMPIMEKFGTYAVTLSYTKTVNNPVSTTVNHEFRTTLDGVAIADTTTADPTTFNATWGTDVDMAGYSKAGQTGYEGYTVEGYTPAQTIKAGTSGTIKYLRELVTVVFDLNGGTWNDSADNIEYQVVKGTALNDNQPVPTPTKSGYTFDGWTASIEGATVNGIFTQRVVFTAQWSSNSRPSSSKHDVIVNYFDQDTGKKIADSYELKNLSRGDKYDVTDKDAIEIEGYTYVKTIGDELKGTMGGSDKVINVYYVKTTDISEPEVPGEELPTIPTDPDQPSDVENPDVPKADAPETGDTALMWVLAAAASGIGLVWLTISGKKRKDETAE